MKHILTLLQLDGAQLRAWFSSEKIGKLFVVVGFFALLGFISAFLYLFTNVFFQNLAGYEHFGSLSATYLFHAGLLMLFFLISVLSTISFCTTLLSNRRMLDLLVVLPLPSGIIPSWMYIKSWMVSFVLFLCFLTPLFLTFYRYFGTKDVVMSMVVSLLVLLSLSLLSTTCGMLCAFLVSSIWQKQKVLVSLGALSIFLLIGYLLIMLIFPKELRLLYAATPEQFEGIYRSLPLVHHLLPSGLLMEGIRTQTIIPILPFVSGAVLLMVVVLSFVSRNFSRVYMSLSDTAVKKLSSQTFSTGLLITKWPLLYREWLSFIRVPQEVGYALFLFLLTLLFFVFIVFSNTFRSATFAVSPGAIVFTSIAFFFFTIAFALRSIFPLMAKEGRNSWHIFTSPLSVHALLHTKLVFSLLLILPYMLCAFLLWTVMQSSSGIVLGVYTALVVVGLAMLISLLGAIHPNFSESENTEKVSTSGMGILALLASLILTGGGSYLLYGFLLGIQPLWMLVGAVLSVTAFMIIVLYLWSKAVVRVYQFP